MLEIKIIQSHSQWNSLLSKCINSSVFCTWEWGEYKSATHIVDRFAFYKKETFVGMIQLTSKKKLGFTLSWVPGGINITDYKYLGPIIDTLVSYINLKKTIVRFNFQDKGTGIQNYIFDEIDHLKQVQYSINSGYTIRHYDKQIDSEISRFDKNSRYYVKKSFNENLVCKVEEPNILKFKEIHDQMASIKEKSKLEVSVSELERLKNNLQDNLKMCSVYDEEGNIISSCLIIIFNKKAHYYLAGSNQTGRKKFASFYMIYNLLKYFKDNSIEEFDFGGITPFSKDASGITRFKGGFGGEYIKYIGERNLTKSAALKFIFNLYIYFFTK